MFTLNTSDGTALINGLGQVLLFPSEASAAAYVAADEALAGKVGPRATYTPPEALQAV